MNRSEIRERFRQENPEITDRVLSDAAINAWLLQGNIQFCCETKIIQKSGTLSSFADEDTYDLSELDDFN